MAPSRKPQQISKDAWYYEAAKSIQVYIRPPNARAVVVRIPWRMLLESLKRSGMEVPDE